MSGFAQLRITREMTWAEKLAHDLEYIADRSVSLYGRVLLATLASLPRRIAGAP
jgi:lipopolysaccharide/colanic/teichoic acid biosynthesis glycosyltransferase